MISFRLLLFVAFFVSLICSFDQLDQELFELQAELLKQEGPDSNFYALLGVDRSAKKKKITSAYRQVSLKVHPDKDGSVEATKKYALLSNVHKVLKNKEHRTRYDHYLSNGFPVWKGTGYMYSRHRPGVIFVIFFLALVGSGTQYIVQRISYSRNKERISYILSEYSKTLNARDLRKLNEQIDREPGTPADHDILPPEFDLSLFKEPTIHDIFIIRFPLFLLRKAGIYDLAHEKAEPKKE